MGQSQDEHPHGHPHESSEARRELHLAEPTSGATHERGFHEPLSSSQRSADTRDLANTDSFQTAHSATSEAPHAGTGGIVNTVLETVGLGGKDHVEQPAGTQHDSTTAGGNSSSSSSSSSTGVLGTLKAAVGLGPAADTNSSSNTGSSGSRYTSERPAWAVSGGPTQVTAEPPVRQAQPVQEPSYGQADNARGESPARQVKSETEHKYGQPYGESEMYQKLSAPQATSAVASDSVLSSSSPTKHAQTESQEYKYGQPYGKSDMHQRLSAPQQASQYTSSTASGTNTGATDTTHSHDQGVSTVDKLKSALGLGSNSAAASSPTSSGTASRAAPASQPEYDSHAQAGGHSELSTQSGGPASGSVNVADSSLSHPTQAGAQEPAYGGAYSGSGQAEQRGAGQYGSQYSSSTVPSDSTTKGQTSTGVLGKLKAAVGVGSAADTDGGVTRSDWSSSHNPTFDSDTPRSGVAGDTPAPFAGSQLTKSLSEVPPSASWGSSAQTASYAPTADLSEGAYSGGAATKEATVGTQKGYTSELLSAAIGVQSAALGAALS